MKKSVKITIIVYIGAVLFTYAMTQRIERLESGSEKTQQNKSIVLKLK